MTGSALLAVFTVLLLSHHVFADNILAIVSMPLGSHYMAFRTLFHELAIRGHNVTVINNFPDKNPPPNLKFVHLHSVAKGPSLTLEFYETIDASYMHWLNIYRHIALTGKNNRVDCETLFTSEGAKAHLAEGREYDVIFVEQFMGDCGLAYALAHYEAPIIGISSHVLLPFAYPRFGIPFDPAADAFYFSNSGPNPSLLQKVETTLVNLFFITVGRWYFHSCIYEAFDKQMPNLKLDIEEEAKTRMKMMFSYQHFSVTGARPLAPQLLEIAGIHVAEPKTVPETLFRELANRGHHVTVMNNFPDTMPVPNLRFVDLQAHSHNRTMRHPLNSYEHINSNVVRLGNIYRHTVTTMLGNDCENLFTNDNAKKHRAEGVIYDVIFVEQFISDCALVYAAALYDAPIIGITSHTLMPWSYSRLGISFDFAADAFYFSTAGPNPTILYKVEAVLINTFLNTFASWRKQVTISGVFSKYLPDYSLDLERVARERLKMVFAYQHFSVTGARVLPPQVLEIGGIHVGTPKRVTPEIEKFLSNATHGAIYVSFGSNLKASTMSEQKLQQFLTAFKRLPYKFIWKYENATFKDDKIYTGDWFPQLDILCHPKILAFVSHGGMLSISETTHCSKPILTVPFFGDQFSNAAAVRAVGLGKTLFFNQLNADNLEETIKELTSPEMQQNVQRISWLWHDRPQPVMQSAIYWTEYVARHKSGPPSLPAKFNTWFESQLIDVYFVILVLILSLGFIIYYIFRFIKFLLMRIISLFTKNKVKRE